VLTAKMRLLLALLSLTVVVNGAPQPNMRALSQEMIDHINTQKTTWKAGHNKRFDGVSIEVIKGMMGVKGLELPLGLPVVDPRTEAKIDLPDNFDGRDQWTNCPSVKEVRDQAACGSCWAFGAVEAMTDRICIQSQGAKNFHISAQDLVSCCKTCGMGCNGGYPTMAWRYWVSHGLVTGSQYADHNGCRSYEVPPCDHHVNGTLQLRWAAAVNRLPSKVSRIIPGDWGKDEPGWLAHPLINRAVRSGSGGRIHQFLWRRSRAVSNAKRN